MQFTSTYCPWSNRDRIAEAERRKICSKLKHFRSTEGVWGRERFGRNEFLSIHVCSKLAANAIITAVRCSFNFCLLILFLLLVFYRFSQNPKMISPHLWVNPHFSTLQKSTDFTPFRFVAEYCNIKLDFSCHQIPIPSCIFSWENEHIE